VNRCQSGPARSQGEQSVATVAAASNNGKGMRGDVDKSRGKWREKFSEAMIGEGSRSFRWMHGRVLSSRLVETVAVFSALTTYTSRIQTSFL
jgi:hypothetical protein